MAASQSRALLYILYIPKKRGVTLERHNPRWLLPGHADMEGDAHAPCLSLNTPWNRKLSPGSRRIGFNVKTQAIHSRREEGGGPACSKWTRASPPGVWRCPSVTSESQRRGAPLHVQVFIQSDHQQARGLLRSYFNLSLWSHAHQLWNPKTKQGLVKKSICNA